MLTTHNTKYIHQEKVKNRSREKILLQTILNIALVLSGRKRRAMDKRMAETKRGKGAYNNIVSESHRCHWDNLTGTYS